MNNQSNFYFVIRNPSWGGLEYCVLDYGQREPEFTVDRIQGTTGTGYGNGSDTGVDG